MKSVVGLGACVLDTLIECEKYPDEDIKSKAGKIVKTGGGPVSNALVTMSGLGIRSVFLGALPDNEDGRFLRDELIRYGVDVSDVKLIEGKHAFTSYILLSKASGSRTCVFERGDIPDDPGIPDFSAIDCADMLHLDGNFLNCALKAAELAKKKGVKVSLDAGSVYDGMEKLLPYIDILIASEKFALEFTGETSVKAAVTALHDRYNPEILAVTQGKKGGKYFEDGIIKDYAGYAVDCHDSNGAGDAFHGAFLAAFLSGCKIGEACRFASAFAAIKCTKIGMRGSLPTFEETLEFMERRMKR